MNTFLPALDPWSELSGSGAACFSAAVGVFDGVHAGHRKLLAELRKIAAETGSVPVAVTFFPHPRAVLPGKVPPPLLVPERVKEQLLREAGAEKVVVLPFDERMSALPPEEFIQSMISGAGIPLKGLCVGREWRFGAGGKGTCADLAVLAEKYSFLFRAVEEEQLPDGRTVSSTLIRKSIGAGDIALAARMLTRPPALYGTVVHGKALAGKVLGYPTANLDLEAGVIPPAGVYAVLASAEGMFERKSGVMSFGYAPTIRNRETDPERIAEIHVKDFSGDLYGKKFCAEIVHFLREERRFSSIEELKKQITADAAQAWKLMGEQQ